MKKYYLFFSLFFFLVKVSAQGPEIPVRFANGNFVTGSNISKQTFRQQDIQTALFNDHYYVLVQFSILPDASKQAALKAKGLELSQYLPGNAYLAVIHKDVDLASLRSDNIRSVNMIPAAFKKDKGIIEFSSADKGNERTIAVSLFAGTDKKIAETEMIKLGASIINTKYKDAQVIFIAPDNTVADKIAQLPFVSSLVMQTIRDQPLNYNNTGTHAITSLMTPSGRNLDGRGVTLGIGDNADASSHTDFTGRLINRVFYYPDYHGTHTAGTVAGGGLLNPKYKGISSKSQLVSQWFSDIITNTPAYITDYGMVSTNNSYTTAENFCPGEGVYDVTSNYIDAQSVTYPNMLHVFAAGNDGTQTCSPYPNGFATIKSGWQCAKNVITVGNIVGATYALGFASSRGPVNDGRLKPEIMANGTNTISCYINDGYGGNSGTSMAAPVVTGVIGLLDQRYRQLNSGANAPSALLKAVLCNGAEDLGNAGPDFTYGFGFVNARRAVEALETNRYTLGTVSNSGTNTQTITVPTGARRLRVMLCWTDKEAAANAAVTLVNDLDLTVTEPSSLVHKPMVLNSAPANINDTAVERRDSLNNIEQVLINNPAAGTYTIAVKGFSVPFGPQAYAVTYQVDSPSVTVEYPFGGETMVPGESEIIRWSAFGNESNNYTVEYSNDAGINWLTKDTVPSTSRSFNWTVPPTPTNKGMIRVSRLGTALSDVSDYTFVVLGQPAVTATIPCVGYANLSWSAITSATSYDIYQLKGDTMKLIGNTTGTSFLVSGLDRYKKEWLAVAARNGTFSGRRSVAVSVIANSGACSLSAFNNDLVVDTILEPNSARLGYSNGSNAGTNLKVRIKNLGTASVSGPFNISFSQDGAGAITEILNTTIAAGGTYDYTFTNGFTHAPEYWNIYFRAWITQAADPHHENDTAYKRVKGLNNDIVFLPYTENFETFTSKEYLSSEMGFYGTDFLTSGKFDFIAGSSRSRARSFVNTGIAYSGSKAITLDQRPIGSVTSDSLIFSLNLMLYSSDQLRLEFAYKNHGQDNLPGNKVWIRASESSPWVQAYDLYANQAGINQWKMARININDVLGTGVPVTNTFQVKFGQEGSTSVNSAVQDLDIDDGYTFDDIGMFNAQNDIGIVQVISPDKKGCGLGNATPVTLSVRNYSAAAVNNVQVSYRINGGTVVNETIPSIAANSTTSYTFTTSADLSAFTDYSCDFWINAAADTYKGNDSIIAYTFHNSPSISSYPYLQGFESSDGYWYAKGTNSSWQWGTPVKTVINKAANGTKAWVTGLNSNYKNSELSYLYSPCFDLSSLAQPVLSFSHIYQVEDNCPCDYTWVEYSTDGGLTWQKLGAVGQGTNWYTDASTQTFKTSKTKWHVASVDVPTTASNVRFRFVMAADGGVTFEGVGVDDIHVFDKKPIYTGTPITSGLSQTVNANGWIDFNDASGKRVVSLNSFGQNLGLTNVQVFPYAGAVRNSNNYYYADRNIVIQPANRPTGNVGVRFYFTDTEAKNLIAANNCATCIKPGDPYELGVTKYNYFPSEEDGSLSNDSSGLFTYILPANTEIIPYDNGYYAEYNVSSFSEFWLSQGNNNPQGNNNCPGDIITYSVVSGAATYQWQENGGSGYVNISDWGNYSGTATTTLRLSGMPTSNSGYKYRCLVNGVPGNEFTLRFTMIWNGSVSTDWANAANWSCNAVPDQYTDVVVPGGLNNYPLVSANASVRSVKIYPNAPVTVAAGVQLIIKGN